MQGGALLVQAQQQSGKAGYCHRSAYCNGPRTDRNARHAGIYQPLYLARADAHVRRKLLSRQQHGCISSIFVRPLHLLLADAGHTLVRQA